MTEPSSTDGAQGPPGILPGGRCRRQGEPSRSCGWLAIAILGAIFVFLLVNSLKAIQEVGLGQMIPGTDWYPTASRRDSASSPPRSARCGSPASRCCSSVPIGIAAAVYLSEFAKGRLKEIAKSIVEFMAAVPSVVLGLLGVAYLAPVVQKTFQPRVGPHRAHGGHRRRRHDAADDHLDLRGRAATACRRPAAGLARARQHELADDVQGRRAGRLHRHLRRGDARPRPRHRRDDGRAHARRQLRAHSDAARSRRRAR